MKKYFTFLFIAGIVFTVVNFSSCAGGSKKNRCDCEKKETTTKTLLVGPSAPNASWSTYDYSGILDADAGCHAAMQLKFMWAADAKAQSGERPPLSYEFQSLFGYFPTNESMERSSAEVDMDTGEAKYSWTILVNEASDKSKPEGSSYGIEVSYTGSSSAENANIICEITIEYRVYDNTVSPDGNCD